MPTSREAGSATLHDSTIAHGVTLHTRVRYSPRRHPPHARRAIFPFLSGFSHRGTTFCLRACWTQRVSGAVGHRTRSTRQKAAGNAELATATSREEVLRETFTHTSSSWLSGYSKE